MSETRPAEICQAENK